jgi:hypothetical protein
MSGVETRAEPRDLVKTATDSNENVNYRVATLREATRYIDMTHCCDGTP